MFPNYIQADSKDCGATCLKIIAKHYVRNLNIQTLRQLSETTREGTNLFTLSEASENIGFRSLGIKLNVTKLEEAPLPLILHWNKEHFVVLYKIKKGVYYISDPAHGLIEYSKQEFLKFWIGNNANEFTQEGIALLLEPTPKFHQSEFEDKETKTFGFGLLFKYLFPYKSFVIQLAIGLLAGSLGSHKKVGEKL
jgi:ATP-binding cassette subfamily B protein